MKAPAEAMRDGARETQHARDEFIRLTTDGAHPFAACAIGSIAYANGQRDTDGLVISKWVEQHYPEFDAVEAACPVSGETHTLWFIIVGLNNHHEWTREAIADWLDSISIDLPVTARREVTVCH